MPDLDLFQPLDPLAALGRLPSGIYILTARNPDSTQSTGMLASWVQQAGFQPPMLTVAVGKDRFVLDWIRTTGRFALNQVPAGRKDLLKHFGKGFGPDEPAFVGLEKVSERPIVLADASTFLEVETRNEVLSGDHVILLCEVVGGGVRSGGEVEPMIHVRRSGSNY